MFLCDLFLEGEGGESEALLHLPFSFFLSLSLSVWLCPSVYRSVGRSVGLVRLFPAIDSS